MLLLWFATQPIGESNMAFNLRHDLKVDDLTSLQITEDNQATIVMDELRVSIQLASNEEADRMAKDFLDESGEGMYDPESPFEKYEQLRQFRP
jgi:hypothetical protein